MPFTLTHHVTTSLRTDVTLSCDIIQHTNKTGQQKQGQVSNVEWILPNGRLANRNDKRFVLSQDNISAYLTIKRLNESDLGLYYCIKVYNESKIEVEQYILDRNVPYFEALRSEMHKNAIIGAVSGGAFLLLCSLLYILWYYRCSERMKRKRQILEDLQKGKDRFNTQLYDNVGLDLYTKRT